MINTESFVLYESVFKDIEHKAKYFGKEMAYDYIAAVCKFGLYGEIPDEDSQLWGYGLEQAFTSISSAKDRRTKNIVDGSKGGRPAIQLDYAAVMQKKEELKTWKAVAAHFNVSENTLRAIRKSWED